MQEGERSKQSLPGQQECCAQHWSGGSEQLALRDRVSREPLGVLVFHGLRTEMSVRSFAVGSCTSRDRYPELE